MNILELLSAYGPMYGQALLTTWWMTALSFILAMVLGLGVTVLRVCPIRPLRLAADFYVQVFRNIPGISLLIIAVYSLPNLGVTLSYIACVIVTVVLVVSAFASENFMSGINTVGIGQIEASRSLGLTFGQMLRLVVVPQALRAVVPPMTNLLIATMLTTALGSQVPLNPTELTGIVSYINTRATGGIATFFISALLYMATALAIGWVGGKVDEKVRIER